MPFENILITEPISTSRLQEIAAQGYGNMVKLVVDIDKELLVMGHEMHYQGEEFLLNSGSVQSKLWGFNIFTDSPRQDWLEYDSMINIRPSDGNKSRSVEDKAIQAKIVKIVDKYIK